MANEQRPQPQNQNKPGGGHPDPHASPLDYLQAKGWKPIGLPEWQHCLWLDPSKPSTDVWTEEKRFIKTAEQTGVDANGKPTYRVVEKQVMAQDGSGSSQLVRPVTQWCFTGKVEPVGTQYALLIQMERDMKAAQKVA